MIKVLRSCKVKFKSKLTKVEEVTTSQTREEELFEGSDIVETIPVSKITTKPRTPFSLIHFNFGENTDETPL